jgi:hypothetical protein
MPPPTGWPRYFADGDEYDPNGPRVQLHSMAAQQLLKDEAQVDEFVMALRRFASNNIPDPATFLQLTDRLLAHAPERGAINGMQRDFEACAKACPVS